MTKPRELSNILNPNSLSGSSLIDETVDNRKLENPLVVNVRDYGAVGNGSDDDTNAFRNAFIAAQSVKKPLFVPSGVYLITAPLVGPESSIEQNVATFSIVGEKNERGSHTRWSIIKYSPSLQYEDQPLVWVWQDGSGQLGSYIFENLFFDLTSRASCLWFGNGSPAYLPISDSGIPGVTSQAYVQGVSVRQCEFRGPFNGAGPLTDEVMSLSSQYVIRLTKCFQSTVEDVTFWDVGRAIYTVGCDKINVRSTRQKAQIPIECVASGSFTVQHTITDFQSETWAFSPIINRGCGMTIADSRIEPNVGTSPYKGKFQLSETATVTENSNTIVFSGSVTGKIIPGYTPIELVNPLDSEDKTLAMVEQLSADGLTATLNNSDTLRIKWSSPGAIVHRFLNYGIYHDRHPEQVSSRWPTSITNLEGSGAAGTPSLLWTLGLGSMYATNCFQSTGSIGTNVQAAVIGNVLANGGSNMGGQLVILGNSTIIPYDRHFRMKVLNYEEQQGDYNVPGSVGSQPANAAAYDVVNRLESRWVFSPDRVNHEQLNNDKFTVKSVPWAGGGANRRINAILFDTDFANDLLIPCRDLPSDSWMRVRMLLKPRVSGQYGRMTLAYYGGNTGLTPSWGIDIDSDEWRVYSTVLKTPSWTSFDRLLYLISNNEDVYFGALILEQLNNTPEIGRYGGLDGAHSVKNTGALSVNTAGSPTVDLFSVDVGTASGFLKLETQTTSSNGYSRRWQQWLIQFGRNGAAYVSNISQIGSDVFSSVNAGVHNPTNQITISQTGGTITIRTSPADLSSPGSTVKVHYNWELSSLSNVSSY